MFEQVSSREKQLALNLPDTTRRRIKLTDRQAETSGSCYLHLYTFCMQGSRERNKYAFGYGEMKLA